MSNVLPFGPTQHTEFADADRKFWASIQAAFALKGYALDRIVGGNGFRIALGQWSIDVPAMTDVMEFAERAGIDTE